MEFIKRHLAELSSWYAVAYVGQPEESGAFVFAPDAYGPCFSFDCKAFDRETIWEAPGGTMSIVPIPGDKHGSFLAIQRFNPGFDAANAEIVYVYRTGNDWIVRTLLKLPYVHRFDILERAGIRYLLCCTLCTKKSAADDWSSPGKIYAARLPDAFDKIESPISLSVIADGMYRNHGYCRRMKDGFDTAVTSCDQGVFEILPPEKESGNWSITKIFDRAASDVAFCDIDGDGEEEMATIEPFHGDIFVIYHRDAAGYRPIYEHPTKLPFCHVLWGGKLRNRPVFLVGNRGERKGLYLVRNDAGIFLEETIEEGSGPSNIVVLTGTSEDLIAVANHEVGEAAVFVVQ